MKKILSLIICGIMLLGFTGCSNSSNTLKNEENLDNSVQENESSFETNDKESNEESSVFENWTQMIHCGYPSKYNSKNYIDYYLNNNEVVRIERLFEYEGATTEERQYRVTELKNDGYKNVQIVDNNIIIIMTSDDTRWKDVCGSCTANDVYKYAENNLYEGGMTCSTKDKE